jgi:hypothetical protein
MRRVKIRLDLLVPGLVAGVVALLAVLATPLGLDVDLRDGPVYLSSAENLVGGNGFVIPFADPGKPIDFDEAGGPVVDFPVGYPAALSIGLILGVDAHDSARLLGVICLGAIAWALTAFASSRGLDLGWAVLIGLTGAALSFPYSLEPRSELLYGLFTVVALVMAARFVQTGRLGPFVLSSLFAALGLLTRTIGIALVGTVGLVGLLVAGSLRLKVFRGLVAVGLGLVPFLFLLSSGGSRDMVWHPPDLRDLKVMVNAVAGWFVPPVGTPTLRTVVFGVALLAAAVWIARDGVFPMVRRWSLTLTDPPRWLPAVISAVAHFGALIASRTLYDAQNLPGTRLLYPVALSLLIAAVEWVPRATETGSRARRVGHVLAASGLAALVANSWAASLQGAEVRDGMLTFRSNDFLSSPVIGAIGELVPEAVVFSNVPDGLWVAGWDGAWTTPVVVDPLTTRPNDLLEEEMAQIAAKVEESQALLVYQRDERDYLVDEASLQEIAPCIVADDGSLVLFVAADHPLCVGG